MIHFPKGHLQLRYVPDGLPLGWLAPGRRWKRMSIVRTHRRPLLATGPNSSAEKSLRTKAIRKRVNQLKRSGEITYVHMRTRAELERIMDALADFYDLRQGAISLSTPFRDDPRKKEFTLRLLEKPGLAHVSVLMQGDMPVAANIGLIGDAYVSLGVVAHSPFHGRSSPGKVHILLLARQLGEQGFRALDLTAGGGKYKDQLADHSDHVYTISIHFNRAAYAREACRSRLRAIVKRALGGEGSALTARLLGVTSMPLGSYMRKGLRRILKPSLGSQRHHYAISPEVAKPIAAENILRVNTISDLLRYRPADRSDQSRKEFFRYASHRLEMGDRAYTLARNGTLLHCAWLSCQVSSNRGELDSKVVEPGHVCLLWDCYTDPREDQRELMKLSLAQRLRDAAYMPGAKNNSGSSASRRGCSYSGYRSRSATVRRNAVLAQRDGALTLHCPAQLYVQ